MKCTSFFHIHGLLLLILLAVIVTWIKVLCAKLLGFFQNLADLHLNIVSFVENTVVKTHINENLNHSVWYTVNRPLSCLCWGFKVAWSGLDGAFCFRDMEASLTLRANATAGVTTPARASQRSRGAGQSEGNVIQSIWVYLFNLPSNPGVCLWSRWLWITRRGGEGEPERKLKEREPTASN